ncbi:MAG: proP [Ramlibacter sp.]|jgi:MFS family permease|nr:proP [Ramlibacter sp.]
MSSAAIRTVLPLATITCTAMLAMDLYLPAVPDMQSGLGLSIPQGQATVAIFLAGLAASQLFWGEALHRWGARRCTAAGLVLLVGGSVGCALANDYAWLMAMRLLQGIGGGASTVVVPAVIKSTLSERDSHRGIAAVSMIEAIVPAAGPVLGTLLLLVADWRWTFGLVALLAFAAAPFALRASPAAPPAHVASGAGYGALLRDGRFVRLALAHSLSFAALFVFVASGPQVLNPSWGMHAFAVAQVVGVAAFIVAASQSGRIGDRLGRARTVQFGAWAHLASCAAFTLLLAGGLAPYGVVLVFWALFCGTLGVRGPAAFSDALHVPLAQVGRASALLVLMLLVCSAAATQITAFFLEAHGLRAVAAGMVLLAAASLALVLRYPSDSP